MVLPVLKIVHSQIVFRDNVTHLSLSTWLQLHLLSLVRQCLHRSRRAFLETCLDCFTSRKFVTIPFD